MLPFDPLLTARIFSTRVSTNVSTLVVVCLMSGGLVANLDSGDIGLARWAASTVIVLAGVFATSALHAGVRLAAYRSTGVAVPQVHLLSFGCILQKATLERSPRPSAIAGAAGMVALIAIPGPIALAIALLKPDGAAREIPLAISVTLGAIVTLQSLPGLGLSGGDVLRGLVWYLTDNVITGARIAAVYAVLIGIALMATGLGMIGLGGARPYLGIWAIVAGWQLSAAARLEVLRTRWLTLAETHTLGEILVPAPRILETATIDTAIDLLVAAGADAPVLVVGSGGTLVGILRLDNLRAVRRTEWAHHTVATIATPVDELPHMPADAYVIQSLDVLDSSDKPFVVVTAPDDPSSRLGALTRSALTRRLHDRMPQ